MAQGETKSSVKGVPLGWRSVAARAAMAWETAWPAMAPSMGVVGLFLALALTDWLPSMPALLHGASLGLFALAFLFLFWRGARRLRWPSADDARRRVEQVSGLTHRPLSALVDQPVGDDPVSTALWRAHRARLLAQIRTLRVGGPRAGLLSLDPRGFRVALALTLAITVTAGWEDPAARLQRAVTPGANVVAALPASLDLWITPPAYTGVAPLFVTGLVGDQAISVPVGSQLLAQVNRAGRGTPALHLGTERVAMTQVDPGAWRVETPIKSGDRLAVLMGAQTLGSWPMTVIPDRPPTIEVKGAPDKTDRSALKIDYHASDDYGIDRGTALIRRPEGGGEPLSLPLGGLAGRRDGQGSLVADLTAHPWAGLTVELVLTVVDVSGQTGQTAPISITLPEREFKHPVAKAVIAQRKNLVREPGKRREVGQSLARIAAQPKLYSEDGVVFMSLMSARARLFLDRDGSSVDAVQSLLWDTALRVEDGELGVQERDLRAAEQALRDALDRNAPDEEIQRLIDQLQTAMDKFLEQMIKQALENPQRQQTPRDRENMRRIDRSDLQRMLDQTRDAAKRGQRDQARAMLDRLQQMMENLKNPQLAEDGDMDGDENSEAMQALQDIESLAQRQRDLMDRGLRQQNRRNQQAQRNRQQRQPGQQGQRQPGQQGQQGQQDQQGEEGDGEEDGDLAGDQEELRRQLGDAMRRLGEAMGNVPGGLGKAERSMRGASDALRRGQPGQAQGPQGDAIDQMRDAARNMMDQMAGQGQGPGMGNPDGRLRNRADSSRPRDQGRDPLGRPTPNATGVDTGDIVIPDDNQAARSREIFEELRRRAGDPQRPALEREYIDRLMRRF